MISVKLFVEDLLQQVCKGELILVDQENVDCVLNDP